MDRAPVQIPGLINTEMPVGNYTLLLEKDNNQTCRVTVQVISKGWSMLEQNLVTYVNLQLFATQLNRPER